MNTESPPVGNNHETEKIALLEQRVKSLESALNKFLKSKEEPERPASDRAATWRKRLQKLGSEYKVFTINRGQKPLANGYYLVARVEDSDPDHFIVTSPEHEHNYGVRRLGITIEQWIAEMENQ